MRLAMRERPAALSADPGLDTSLSPMARSSAGDREPVDGPGGVRGEVNVSSVQDAQCAHTAPFIDTDAPPLLWD